MRVRDRVEEFSRHFPFNFLTPKTRYGNTFVDGICTFDMLFHISWRASKRCKTFHQTCILLSSYRTVYTSLPLLPFHEDCTLTCLNLSLLRFYNFCKQGCCITNNLVLYQSHQQMSGVYLQPLNFFQRKTPPNTTCSFLHNLNLVHVSKAWLQMNKTV